MILQSCARKEKKQEETYSHLDILQYLVEYRLSFVNQRGEDISHECLYSHREVELT